jgi:hypothetical protein
MTMVMSSLEVRSVSARSDAGVKFKSFTEQYVDSLGVFGDAIIGRLAAMVRQSSALGADTR